MVNVNSFDLNLLQINKFSCKSANISIYYFEYLSVKSLDHIKIDSENLLYIIFNNIHGNIIEQRNEDKYFTFASTNQNKKILAKHTKLWNEFADRIKTINVCKPIKYKKDFMKIGSDDDLP